MSDNDEDLFADSDDTDDLIAQSSSIAKKKTPNTKLKRKRDDDVPDADNDSGDDSDDDIGGGKSKATSTADKDDAFLDSDDSDDDAPLAKKKKKAAAPAAPKMSKRERMEALQKKKRNEQSKNEPAAAKEKRQDKLKRQKEQQKQGGGNRDDDEESVDSAAIELTEEDRNFIDTEGDDADAVHELYAEQHFDDEEAEEHMEMGGKKKKGRGGYGGGGGRRSGEAMEDNGDTDNPIMQAVNKMKKKKKEKIDPTERENICKEFIQEMDEAAAEDEIAVKERRPALQKLKMLTRVVDMLTVRDMQRTLLDLDLLTVLKRWLQPLSTGKLGNLTIRQRLIESIAKMGMAANREDGFGITPHDLKQSEFGKVIMALYMHKDETPMMKRQLKTLIEQWSRPIFKKSENMRDLERVQHERGSEYGLAKYSRMQQQYTEQQQPAAGRKIAPGAAAASGGSADLNSIITSGASKNPNDAKNKRVRVPFSKGFQYTVRPQDRTMHRSPDRDDGGPRGKPETAARGNLAKRMIEKSRKVSKNQRSANVSVEGRKVK